MGRRPEKGRRGAGKRGSTQPGHRRGDAARERAGAREESGSAGHGSGPTRLLLTRLLHGGAIWNVYVARTAESGGPNRTQLEFEAAGAASDGQRYTRRVEGEMLDALHRGKPVSRSALEEELELALRDAGAIAGDAAAPAAGSEPAAPAAGSEPAAPAAGIEPAAPAAGSEPAAPAAGSEPAAPAAGSEPAAPAAGSEPAAPAAGSEPAAPAAGSERTAPAADGPPNR